MEKTYPSHIYSSFQLLSQYVGNNKEYPVGKHQTLPSSTLQAKEGLTFGSISLLRGWTNTGRGLLERRAKSQTCQCFRSIFGLGDCCR